MMNIYIKYADEIQLMPRDLFSDKRELSRKTGIKLFIPEENLAFFIYFMGKGRKKVNILQSLQIHPITIASIEENIDLDEEFQEDCLITKELLIELLDKCLFSGNLWKVLKKFKETLLKPDVTVLL